MWPSDNAARLNALTGFIGGSGVEAMIDRASADLRAGRYDDVVAAARELQRRLRDVVDERSRDVAARVQDPAVLRPVIGALMGRALLGLGQEAEGRAALEIAVAELQGHTESLSARQRTDLAGALLALHRVPDALAVLRSARRDGMADVDGLDGLVQALRAEAARQPDERPELLQEAAAVAEEWAERAPDELRAWQVLGDVRADAGERSSACVAYQRAAALALGADDIALALELYGRARAADPEDMAAVVGHAVLLAFTGQTDPALAALDGLPEWQLAQPALKTIRARILREAQRFPEAEEDARAAVAGDPAEPQAWMELAEALVARDESTEALAALEEVIERDPDNVRALRLRAALTTASEPEAAEATLDRALELEPGEPWTQTLRARLRRARGDLDGARADLRAVLERDPEFADALAELAELSMGDEDLEGALEVSRRAIDAAPEDPRALRGRAEALRRSGDLDGTLPILDRLGAATGEDAWTRGTRGQVYRALGRSPEALDELRAAHSAAPDVAWITSELAAALRDAAEARRYAGDYEGTVPLLDEIEATVPGDAWAAAVRAEVARAGGDLDEAIRLLRHAVGREPGLAFAWTDLVRALKAKDRDSAPAALDAVLATVSDPDQRDDRRCDALMTLGGHEEEALALAARLSAERPDDVTRMVRHAQILRLQERFEEARKVLDEALSVDPHDLGALREHGYLLLDQKDASGARGVFKAASELRGDADPWLLGDVAYVDMQLGRFRRARERLAKSLALDPNHPFTLLLQGRLLFDLGRYGDSAELLRGYTRRYVDDDFGVHVLGASLANGNAEAADPAVDVEAADAHRRALALNDSDPWYHAALADSLFVQSDREAAARESYERATEIITADFEADAPKLALLGWCYAALGRRGEAIRGYVHALSRGFPRPYDAASAAFSLAWIRALEGQAEAASTELDSAIAMAAELEPEARRGCLALAVAELCSVLRTPLASEFPERPTALLERMRDERSAADGAVTSRS
jgi:tetratricopeptide (TPR) repeat protein